MADAINTRLAALDAQRKELSSQKRALITNNAISAEDRKLLNESYDKDIAALNTQITKLTNDLSGMFFSPSAVTKTFSLSPTNYSTPFPTTRCCQIKN